VEVKKHIQRMASAGCSTPALRLIYVRQQHEAAPNVRYLPACTWLHRCSDETGCCTDDSKICSASHIESVSLPFFVSPFIFILPCPKPFPQKEVGGTLLAVIEIFGDDTDSALFFCSAASLVSLTCLPVCSVWDPNSLSCFFCPTIAQTDFLPLRL
jgi:hypothetical protein